MYIVHIILLQRKCVIRVINMFVSNVYAPRRSDDPNLKNAEKCRNCILFEKRDFLEREENISN